MPKCKQPKTQLEKKVMKFISEVASVSPTNSNWKGTDVDCGFNQFKATRAQRDEVNFIGAIHGCHSCLTKVDTDRNQPWIGDHQPPTNLKSSVRQHAGLPENKYDGTVRLYPQCDECSREQSGLVNGLNGGTVDIDALDALELSIIGVSLPPDNPKMYVNATSEKVHESQGLSIQRLGTVHGCHSCQTKFPKDIYHADHNPPICYTYSHVQKILQWASNKGFAVEIPTSFVLRPQCPRCSHAQGGAMKKLKETSKYLATELNIPTY